jgi:hypothetical protein
MTLQAPAGPVDDVLCQVLIPPPGTDKPQLQFRPTPEQYPRLEGPQLTSLRGPLRAVDGTAIGEVRCQTAWVRHAEQRFRDGHQDALVEAEAVDLQMTQFIGSESEAAPTEVWFWITSNRLLTPWVLRTPEASGAISVERPELVTVSLTRDIQIQFDLQYDTWHEDEALHQSGRLVATATLPNGSVETDLLHELDDLLLLSSFLARRRTVCSGWTLSTPGRLTSQFRGDVGAPSGFELPSLQDGIVKRGQLGDFLKTAWPAFQRLQDPEPIRHVIYTCVPNERPILQSDIMALFSSLEDFLFSYRHQSGLAHIVPPRSWKALRNEIKVAIGNTSDPPLEQHQRDWLNQNLSGLNRMPLRVVFDRLVQQLRIDVSDLWPLFDHREGPSIYQVRNRLVHGGGFPGDAVFALTYVTEHLRWLLERIVLAVLQWPVAESDVAPDKLAQGYTGMLEWRDARQRLQQAFTRTTATPADPDPDDCDSP